MQNTLWPSTQRKRRHVHVNGTCYFRHISFSGRKRLSLCEAWSTASKLGSRPRRAASLLNGKHPQARDLMLLNENNNQWYERHNHSRPYGKQRKSTAIAEANVDETAGIRLYFAWNIQISAKS